MNVCPQGRGNRRIRVLASAGVLTALAAMTLTAAQAGAAPALAPHAGSHVGRMTPAVLYPGVPHVRTSGPSSSGLFKCQAPASSANRVPCYGPAQIRKAYDVPNSLTGAGQTIVIIDAFQSPTIQNDLNTFDATFGLPAAQLNIIAPQGLTPFNPASANQLGWSLEISLDVEYAHAIAPGATIDLVLAKSDQDPAILAAQQYAIVHQLGAVMSQSFGEGETCMDPAVFAAQHTAFVLAALRRMSVFASAGDSGSSQPDCNGDSNYFLSASTPASDPLVTGVGGTHLSANFKTGSYQSETVWNDSGNPVGDFGAGGGGFSAKFLQPAYQLGLRTHGARGVPDVAYSGDVINGVLVAWSESGQGANRFFIVGGTSAGAPQWAGIAALADQAAGHALGSLNPALYAIGGGRLYHYAFHDITVGNNAWDVAGVPGYPATAGWDAASGLGSPDVTHLIKLLTSTVLRVRLGAGLWVQPLRRPQSPGAHVRY
jgi:subtilase family serine protease